MRKLVEMERSVHTTADDTLTPINIFLRAAIAWLSLAARAVYREKRRKYGQLTAACLLKGSLDTCFVPDSTQGYERLEWL